jgi:hypothetical protein
MLALTLKVAGLVVAAAGGTVALLGNTSKGHRLTRNGWWALSLLAIGLMTSLATELITTRETARNSKASERWEVEKTLPMTMVIYYFNTRHPTTAGELVAALNRMQVSFSAPSEIVDGGGVRTPRWTFDAAVTDVQQASRLEVLSEDRVIASSRVGLSVRTPSGWSSSVYDDWASDDYKRKVGGIQASLSWQDHGFGPKITEMVHLARLGLEVVVPDETFLDQFASADITIWATGDTVLSIDVKALNYLNYTNYVATPPRRGRIARLQGKELVDLLKSR